MKSVLISIQPRWCELIASGKKTIEVRKTKPKFDMPFKVYIYETQGRTETPFIDEEGHHIFKGRGQVIGEFVCEKVLESFLNNNDGWFIEKGCLTQEEIDKYQGDKAILYGWHISNLVIYNKPKDLGKFARFCDGVGGTIGCRGCKYYYTESNESIGFYEECGCDNLRPLKRPPQSWCYVESIEQQ